LLPAARINMISHIYIYTHMFIPDIYYTMQLRLQVKRGLG
jgi:hypothetical protein